MTVVNGDLANQTEFNTSFMSREQNTSTVGKVGLLEASSTSFSDIQNFLNALKTAIGGLTNAEVEGKTIDWSAIDADANIIGTNTDTITNKLVSVILLFLGAGGHSHDGSNGNGPKIDLVNAVNGILNPVNGGTGLDASLAPDGSLLIGNSAGFTLATITGTANQVIVSNGSGSITLSLPQDIHAGATPTFDQVLLTLSPTLATHAASKSYVDSLVNGQKWKQSVRAATTVDGTLASDFEDGDTLDGVTLATGDRILIKDQSTASENGIYEVQASGAPVRTSDADEFGELNSAAVFVEEGSTNADKGFYQSAELTSLSDNQVWVQSFGTGSYSVNGLALQELTAGVFSLVIDGSTLTQSASGLKVADGVFMTLAGDQSVSGGKTFNGYLKLATQLIYGLSENSTLTGADQTIPAPSTVVVELTNASLTSLIGMFASAPTDNLSYIVINSTGNDIEVKHDSGSPAETGFLLPDNASFTFKNNTAIKVVYSTLTDRNFIVGGAGSGGSGSGFGGINYIENAGAETDTTGWETYQDAAQATPEDGTGGSPTVTITQNTTDPLIGDADFLMTKDAANRQGEGASYPFTIDNALQSKVNRISFYYKGSANFSFANGDVKVFVRDFTNGIDIPLSNNELDGSGRFIGEFQASPDSVSYRLIFHIATTNALAWTFNFDNVQVGPRELVKSYLPNRVFTNFLTTNITVNNANITDLRFDNLVIGKLYRLDFQAQLDVENGDSATALAYHNGNVVLALNNESRGTAGENLIYGTSSTFIAETTSVVFETQSFSAGTSLNGDGTKLRTFAQLHELNDYEGANQVVQSSDFGNRVIAGNFYITSPQSIPNATQTDIIFNSEDDDNTGGLTLNSSTGEVTIGESGWYNVAGSCGVSNLNANNAMFVSLIKNGSVFAQGRLWNATTGGDPIINAVKNLYLLAGDVIKLAVQHNLGVNASTYSIDEAVYLSIHKIQSPQTLLGGEPVAARYTNESGQSLPNNAETIVNFEDKELDTHNAVTIGSAWEFVAPIAGLYLVSVSIRFSSFPFGTNRDSGIGIHKNGDRIGFYGRENEGSATANLCEGFATLVQLNKGDSVDARAFHDAGSTQSLSPDKDFNFISIHKVN